MNKLSLASDNTVQKEIGSRLARYRLNRNLTQSEMAEEAGVSRATIARLENGSSTQLSNFIRVLRALDLLERIDVLIPEPQASPMEQLKMAGKQRQRASTERKSAKEVKEDASTWQWEDE